jgi:hypothetical protein
MGIPVTTLKFPGFLPMDTLYWKPLVFATTSNLSVTACTFKPKVSQGSLMTYLYLVCQLNIEQTLYLHSTALF